jgi:cobalt-zinc-cadmium efflux system membrane fusion protein
MLSLALVAGSIGPDVLGQSVSNGGDSGLGHHRIAAEEPHEHGDHDPGEHDHTDRDPGEHDHAEHNRPVPSEGDALDAHDRGRSVPLSAAMQAKIGLEIKQATAGPVTTIAVLPAEITLNRNRLSVVSPPYPSLVRQVFADVGDRVRKDDVLASLENRETLGVYTVHAPLNGLVIDRDVAQGETVGENDALFQVADLSSVWAEISVFPRYRHRVRPGMPVEFIAHDGHTASGIVDYISPLVSHQTRTFMARSVLEKPDEDFMPGAFVRAAITLDSADAPLRVERAAVQTIDGEAIVFVAEDHGFVSRDVVLGRRGERFVEILDGLKPGERYVSSGAFVLKAEFATQGLDPHAGHGH